MKKLIDDLLSGSPVDIEGLEEALHRVMSGEAEDIQIAGLLVALRSRPVEGRVLAAMARAMRQHRVSVTCQVRPLIDTCGTGGDGSGTFNISTAAAFVVAGAGGAVAKHGNRGVSSRTGSADVLEALGVQLDVPADAAAKMIDAAGFSFLFAPRYHPAMKHVMPVRNALGIRTHFNLLGPLSNPALAEYQVLGVYAPELTLPMAEALCELGTRAAMVIHCDGVDEICLHAPTKGHLVKEGEIEEIMIDPLDFGVARAAVSDLAGGEAEENAAILKSVLAGESGPRSDVVALNAGAACWMGGLAGTLAEGLEVAREVLRDGRATKVLDRAVASSARLGVNSE